MPVRFELYNSTVTAHEWAAMIPFHGDNGRGLPWGPGDPIYEALTREQRQRLKELPPTKDVTVVVADGRAVITPERVVPEASNISPPAKVDTVERINARGTNIEHKNNEAGYTYAVVDGYPREYERWSDDDVVTLKWNVPSPRGSGGAFDFS